MFRYIFLWIVLGIFVRTQAQSDCHNAVLLTDTVYHIPKVTGFGKNKEFNMHPLGNKYYFPTENKSVWYKIPVTQKGTFYFDIIPDNPADDWDFLVFKLNTDSTCRKIITEQIQPLRSNIARNNLEIQGKTGLNKTSNYTHVTSGINPAYCKALPVNTADTLLIVVNNYKNTTNGHTIRWYMEPEKNTIKPQKTEKTEQPVKPVNGIKITLNFVNEKQQPLLVSGLIKGLFPENITLNNQQKIDTVIPKKTTYVEVMVSAKGYLLTYDKFKIAKNKLKYEQTIELQPITKNSNVKLPNILFKPASDRFLPGSFDALKILQAFMTENPSVKIEIQGHVNGPGMPNTKDYKELSMARAKAVYQYLIDAGINASRLKYKGFGNTKMVYPDPKSERESSMNRRVEIKILEF